jgi:hypothetical protein
MANKLLLALAVLFMASTAHAANTGDMFGDRGVILNRPWVPNDRFFDYTSRTDMFGAPKPVMRESKDMFDSVAKPGVFGTADMFRANVSPVPDEPLYHWPKGTSYP